MYQQSSPTFVISTSYPPPPRIRPGLYSNGVVDLRVRRIRPVAQHDVGDESHARRGRGCNRRSARCSRSASWGRPRRSGRAGQGDVDRVAPPRRTIRAPSPMPVSTRRSAVRPGSAGARGVLSRPLRSRRTVARLSSLFLLEWDRRAPGGAPRGQATLGLRRCKGIVYDVVQIFYDVVQTAMNHRGPAALLPAAAFEAAGPSASARRIRSRMSASRSVRSSRASTGNQRRSVISPSTGRGSPDSQLQRKVRSR